MELPSLMNDGELFFLMTFRPLPPEPIDNGLWEIQDCLLLNVFAVTLNTWGINFNHSVNLIKPALLIYGFKYWKGKQDFYY